MSNPTQLFPAWDLNPAHLMSENEDCMGNLTPSYWRAFAIHKTHSPGLVVIGFGGTEQEAKKDLFSKVKEKDEKLKLQTV